MPSFDIVSQIDLQEVDNAVNNVKKELRTRFDFRNVPTELSLNKKDKRIELVTGDEMKVKALHDLLIAHFTRRKVDHRALIFQEPEATSKGQLKESVRLMEGIDKDTAKRIVKIIKDKKLKVQASIQDDQVRVAGKKIDDLQAVIRVLQDADFELPLQYVNMKK
ncbi:hypothetical protein SAMN02745704_01091 [Paucidesulfovibrio gracilis DSM 16080]|uniref:Nucleotide-binding protein SAMN02745704_01091 n=1 Tax=Paucidesulfovibrio gracilis DSM 16080 TaxID=1121449 RepID=A0A1T4WML7_9BACT|nr:YajQ family cyclic di-GMP-binding protein [Paucidesulfovibrio gracilis]SKA78128.1 hypothetical protein SAMN02745704_01091 [Paucidesulfovibrio gracilis DSM 16080]